MDFNWNVLLVLILFSASLKFSCEFALRHVETSTDLPARLTYSDWLSSVGQRSRRHAESDSTEDYEGESSQEECRCPQGLPSRGSSDRRQGYPRQSGSRRDYPSRRRKPSWWFGERDDYADDILAYRFYNGGYSNTETDNGPGRRGYQQGGSGSGFLGGRPVGGGSSGRSGSGYPSRRRGSNWWFDGRSDYADEILVYRFYNGKEKSNFRNIPSRRGYQSERGGGSNRRTGTRESDYSEVASEHDSEDEFTEYESSDSGTSESTPKRKVKTFRYITGIMEIEKGDDVEESSPPTKYRRIGSTGRSDKSLFGTITQSPPAAADYNQDNCCYQRGHRRNSGYNTQRYTTRKPNNFFRITWTKMLDYTDVSEEVDSDGRSINVDLEKDRKYVVKNSEEQVAAVVEEEVVETTEDGTETNVEEVTMTST